MFAEFASYSTREAQEFLAAGDCLGELENRQQRLGLYLLSEIRYIVFRRTINAGTAPASTTTLFDQSTPIFVSAHAAPQTSKMQQSVFPKSE
jgi:hypothetical protein